MHCCNRQKCLKSKDPEAQKWAHIALHFLESLDTPADTTSGISNDIISGVGRAHRMSMRLLSSASFSPRKELSPFADISLPATPQESLATIPPLIQLVDWYTWGSRLDTYFDPVHAKPKPSHVMVTIVSGETARFCLGGQQASFFPFTLPVCAPLWHTRDYRLIQPPDHGQVILQSVHYLFCFGLPKRPRSPAKPYPLLGPRFCNIVLRERAT